MVVRIKVIRLRLRRKRMLDHDALGQRALAAGVLYLRDFRPVRVAGMLPGEIRDVIVWPRCLIAGEDQLHDERSALNFLAGIHVRHALHQQKSGPDFQFVALVLQLLQIPATTYQWV